MGFWVFMLICCLLMPAIMVAFGGIWQNKPPKTINAVYGYRTARSTINQETWDFAHKTCGKLWWKMGWIMLCVSLAVFFPFLGKSEDIVGFVGTLVVILQLIAMIASTVFVETALKRRFDQNGNPSKTDL